MEISNLNLSGITVTDELYTDFGASSSALTGWPAFKADGFAIYEDATPHAGSPLVLDTDYTLDNKDIRKSQELGEDVYTKITMLTHTTGNIYISYTSIGSYIDADDIRNVLNNFTINRPTVLDISSGNQATDLSVYETGGGSAKQSGYRIQVSWTGGDGTYFHLWTGTGYTINGQAIADFICAGTGNVVLELDNTNSDWILIHDNREPIYILYTGMTGVSANTIINFATKEKDNYSVVTTGAGTWKFTCPKTGWYTVTSQILVGATASIVLYKGGSQYLIGNSGINGDRLCSGWTVYLVKDEYIDIRSSGSTQTNTFTFVSVLESKR